MTQEVRSMTNHSVRYILSMHDRLLLLNNAESYIVQKNDTSVMYFG